MNALVQIDELCPHCGVQIFIREFNLDAGEHLRCPDCFHALLLIQTGKERFMLSVRAGINTFGALCGMCVCVPGVLICVFGVFYHVPDELMPALLIAVFGVMFSVGLYISVRGTWYGAKMLGSLHIWRRRLVPARVNDGVVEVALPQTDYTKKHMRAGSKTDVSGGLSLRDELHSDARGGLSVDHASTNDLSDDA